MGRMGSALVSSVFIVGILSVFGGPNLMLVDAPVFYGAALVVIAIWFWAFDRD